MTMLRYLYLLCLLVCIRVIFCYEYITDQDTYNARRGRRVGLRHRRARENGRRFVRRQDYDMAGERDPVAEIDVASFIQKPDYDSADNGPYVSPYKKSGGISKEYPDYGTLTGLEGSVEKRSQDYIYQGANNLNEKPYMYKNLLNPRHTNLNSMNMDRMYKKNDNADELGAKVYSNEFVIDKTHSHKQVKKCPLKQMKVPFFSRKKTGTTKAKKIKKRRLFCFNCGNKTKAVVTSTPNIDPNLSIIKEPYKINKRSYNERICPICQRKFARKSENTNTRSRRTSSRMIHNSRQFYQKKRQPNAQPDTETPLEDEDNDSEIEERRKRDNESDRERQLKELEEVQKKIDNIDLNSIGNAKSNTANSDPNVS